MAIGSIYKLVHRQTLYNEPMENVYWFRGLVAESSAEDLIDAWQSDLQPLVLDVQSTNVEGLDIRVISVGDFTDFAVETDTLDGTGTSDETDDSVRAVHFSMYTNVRNIGPGGKRIGGVPNTRIAANYITDAAYLTLCNALRIGLADTIGVGAVEAYEPIIVKRIYVPADENHPKPYYREPATMGEVVYAKVTSCLLKTKISHQVSRIDGR